MSGVLEIRGLRAAINGKEILKGVDLSLPRGEVHAVMGPNGSGKSTLSNVVMGHPAYQVTGGDVLLDGESILKMAPDERARKGLFLSFQYPTAIPGVKVTGFLKTVLKNIRGEEQPVREFRKEVKEGMELLRMDPAFQARYVNDGFSGGEKKRLEILQMLLIRPRVALLDETDSGLDIDALRTVSQGIESLRGPDRSMILITHYQRILNHVRPDRVHVFADGRMILSGGIELAERLEEEGYDTILADAGVFVRK